MSAQGLLPGLILTEQASKAIKATKQSTKYNMKLFPRRMTHTTKVSGGFFGVVFGVLTADSRLEL